MENWFAVATPEKGKSRKEKKKKKIIIIIIVG